MANKSKIFVNFAESYHSWERRTNENASELIWQNSPKGTDSGDIADGQVMRVQDILNSRLRKDSGYIAPKERNKY